MSSIKIIVSQDDSSQEYVFHHSGPITLGNSEGCDVRLNSEEIQGKLLQVKIIAGRIFVREVSNRGNVILDKVALPYMREVAYAEGKGISIANTRIQIHFSLDDAFSHEPPVFIADMDRMLKARENEIKKIETIQEMKANTLEDTEQKIHQLHLEKNSLEIESAGLKGRKDELEIEINRKKQKLSEEEVKHTRLQEQVTSFSREIALLERSISEKRMALDSVSKEYDSKLSQVIGRKDEINALHHEKNLVEESIVDLKHEYNDLRQQVSSEAENTRSVLMQLDSLTKEKAKLDSSIFILRNEEKEVGARIHDLELSLKGSHSEKDNLKSRVESTRKEIDKERIQLKVVQDRISEEVSQEKKLKVLNEELRLELIKIEDKLAIKKNQFNQLDFQSQELNVKVQDLIREVASKDRHVKELEDAQRREEGNLGLLKKTMSLLQEQHKRDQERLGHEHHELKFKYQMEIKTLSESIHDLNAQKQIITEQLGHQKENSYDMEAKNNFLIKKQVDLESAIQELEGRREDLTRHLHELKAEEDNLMNERGRLEHEISVFKIKLLDTEAFIRQKEKEAFVEIENMKREERSKLMAERYTLMNDVEVNKNRSIQEMMEKAQTEADAIIAKAREFDQEVSQKATLRLREATDEAMNREKKAHDTVKEALELYHNKEAEAERILAHAKENVRELVAKHEIMARAEKMQLNEELRNLDAELQEKKAKTKEYLSDLKERNVRHLTDLKEKQEKRLLKDEKITLLKLERKKRREFKKVANLRNAELERREKLFKETTKKIAELKRKETDKVESLREKLNLELKLERERLENELAQTKRANLERMNQTKMQRQEKWEEELKRDKANFEATKKQRVQNAGQAVYNILLTKGLINGADSELQTKILSTLEASINGNQAVEQAEQILEFNPEMKKKARQVIGKYFVRVGIPVMVVTALLADIGSVRTGIQNQVVTLLKQSESSSDIFVKNKHQEWKEKYTYNPETSVGYKESYTDNLLYTTDFMKVMDSEAFQNDWILALHNFIVTDLELSEELAINYISSEGAMLKEMSQIRKEINPQYLDQGLGKLKDLEKSSLGWVDEKLADPIKKQKFVAFRKNYYEDFYKEKFNAAVRNIAAEKKL